MTNSSRCNGNIVNFTKVVNDAQVLSKTSVYSERLSPFPMAQTTNGNKKAMPGGKTNLI